MSDSQLLHFAYADFEEERRNYENAKKIYDKLIAREHVDPTLVRGPSYLSLLLLYIIDGS